jgi:lysophospholipase L1-like esterase
MHGEPLRWQLKTNAAGHRGAPYPPTTTAPVIVALGDSSTFGFRVNDNETYSAQLQTNLRTHGLAGATVVNYGIPGYTSFQGRRFLTEILTQHDPDFVLLSFGANDQKTDILSDADKAERISTAQLEYSDYFGLPATVRLFREPPTFERRKPTDPTAPPLRVSPEEFRVNMQAMIHFAQRRGAQVILLDLILAEPVLGEVIHELALENQLPRIDGRTLLRDELLKLLEGRRHQAQRVARQQFWKDELDRYRPIYYSPSFFNDLFADPVWNGLLLFFLVDPLHPNALGHQVIAEALAPLIDPSRSETVTEPESATHP